MLKCAIKHDINCISISSYTNYKGGSMFKIPEKNNSSQQHWKEELWSSSFFGPVNLVKNIELWTFNWTSSFKICELNFELVRTKWTEFQVINIIASGD